MGVLTTAGVAIDGNKFKAVNTRNKNFTRGKPERHRAQLEKSVARYLAQLDIADLQSDYGTLLACGERKNADHHKERLSYLRVGHPAETVTARFDASVAWPRDDSKATVAAQRDNECCHSREFDWAEFTQA